MNFGMIALSLLLLCGAVLGIGILAGASHPAYVDSYGNTTTSATNLTQANVTSGSAPLSGAAGGVVIAIGVFVVIAAGFFLARGISGSRYGGRS